MAKTTPLHSRTSILCHSQRWQLWEDYLIADSYDFSSAQEYYAIRNTAAIFDFSPLYVYHITGRDSLRFINQIVTRDVRNCLPYEARYTAWCDEKGQVIDDGLVIRLDEDTWQITANTDNMAWFTSFIKDVNTDVCLEDKSSDIVTIPVQGPLSAKILNASCADRICRLPYFSMMNTTISGHLVRVSRTGYTGDLGYEIWCRREDAISIWDAVMVAGECYGITPCGFGALDIARMEAGLIWCGYDYRSANLPCDAGNLLPWELNLGRVVDLSKEDFSGKQALARTQHAPDISTFGGFIISMDESPLTAAMQREVSLPWRRLRRLITASGECVGWVTSGGVSPALQSLIAMGRLQKLHPDEVIMMEVEAENGVIHYLPAQQVSLPFLSLDRKRARPS